MQTTFFLGSFPPPSAGTWIFTGLLTCNDLSRALASSDLLLNPSITEAFGNVTLEAMACALPVLAAEATGATNLVRDKVTGMLVDGTERQFTDPSDARAAGIETVFQNLALVPTLNILENIYLNREELGPGPLGRGLRIMNKRAMRREVRAGFERFGVTLPAMRTKVSALSGGQRQQVAVTRAVMWGSHIVLMDEPAAALGVRQTELVLSLVERLKSHGVALVFISHNRQHVLRVADRVAVLFLGRKVADFEVGGATQASELVALMTGAAGGDPSAAEALP